MRRLPLIAALLWSAMAGTDEAAAQAREQPEVPAQQASTGPMVDVIGRVTDETGAGIDGASVLAMGATVAVVRTDRAGRFRLSLTPGPYILRAAHDGYISTFREAVDVRSGPPLARHITMLRAGTTDVVLASLEQPAAGASELLPEPEAAAPERSVPSETAWRLRHLPRTVLRDGVSSFWQDDQPDEAETTRVVPVASMLLSQIGQAEFTGHVDLLTTGALPGTGDLPAGNWPRGVAYVVIGAPVGGHGEWTVRTSMAGGQAPAWTLAGEYATRESQPHAFRAGVSYSAQTMTPPDDRHALASIDTVRRVGGVHVSDRWTVNRNLELSSSLGVTRYDYLSDPTLLSGHVGGRQRVWSRFSLVGTAASHRVAPGGDQFAPPRISGVWLPPERTFSALNGGDLLPEHVQSYEIGADAAVLQRGDEPRLTLRVRRFSEQTSNQIVALFGVEEAGALGHYYVGTAGSVALDGWVVGVSAQVATHVQATVDYATTAAEWQRPLERLALWGAAPSAVRSGVEQLHDVTATIDAAVPSTATSLVFAVRVNSGFSRPDWDTPGYGGRFSIEVRQQLPVQPLGHGELNLLFSARTLQYQMNEPGGFYDELLTVAPPVRLMSGVQMRF